MQLYGASLIWGTAGAPQPATCILDSCDYRMASQVYNEPDGQSDHAATLLYKRKAGINFAGTITDETTDLPDLSKGAKIGLSHAMIVGGMVLCSSLIEEWAMDQSKKFNGSATHYPDCTGGTGADAGSLSGVFAQTGAGAPVIRPASRIAWSTHGLTSALGTVQRLRIEQSLTLTEPPTDPMKITAVIAHAYQRKISLAMLALPNAALPATDTVLTVTGAPAHAGGAVVTDAGFLWKRADAAMLEIEAFWQPTFA